MTGNAKVEELENLFVFVCSAHVMKNIKKHAVADKGDPLISAKQHLAMRFSGRLINTSTLGEASEIVKAGFLVFKSEFVTPVVASAIKDLEDAINDFSKEVDFCMDEVNDGTEVQEEATKSNMAFSMEEKQLLIADKTAIKRYWKAALDPLQDKLKSTEKKLPHNKCYIPEFMDYCQQYLLPSIALWSKICTGSFEKFNDDYRKRIERESSTNGTVERYFGLLKQDEIKPGLDKTLS